MGGGGAPPDVRPRVQTEPVADNVTAFRRPPAPRPAARQAPAAPAKPRLPVALIFICLVVVYVGIRYFWK